MAKYPNRKVRGFHFNSLASTFFGWDKIVKGFIEADQALKKGNIELMKSWVNTELGQTWEEQGEKASKDDLLKRRERYRCEVPDEVIAITAGIDTQDDRFEVEVVGWGVEHESYGIIYKRIYGDLKQSEVWKNLDDFLKQTFKKADGTAMRISCACMDSGGHFTNKVYRFCKARTARKIFAIKGGNEGTARPYISKPTKNNREQAYLFTLGVDTGKSLLLQRLQIEEEGPGYCHFPKDENEYIRGYDEDYFKGLTAEKQVLKYKKGRPYFVWELTGETKRNEPLDCRNYAQAAIEITGLKQLGRYTEAEVLAAVINGLFTVFIEKESASDDVPFGESIPEEMQVDQEDENSIELAPGAVIDLGEGEKANMVNPGRPNPNFDPFVIAVLKQIGAALEIPYEILIMAFSSNYSASRAAILEFFKVVKMYRAWFVADFCQPIYEEWLSEAVAKGRIKAPGFFTDPIIKDAYCSAEWTGPSAGQLDPTKEVEAAEKRVQGGYSTREREARELTGTDFYKNIKQRKREEELLKEVTGGAKTDAQTVENINGREESDTENNPDNDGGQTEEETEE